MSGFTSWVIRTAGRWPWWPRSPIRSRVASLDPLRAGALLGADGGGSWPAGGDGRSSRCATRRSRRSSARTPPRREPASWTTGWAPARGPGMPEAKREAVTAAMPGVKAEWGAAFRRAGAPGRLRGPRRCRCCCISGSESPASAPRDGSAPRRRRLPRVTAVEVEGAGHMGPVTHPDRVNALIERYLTDGRDYTNRIDEEEWTWQVRPRRASSRKRC